MLEAALTFAAAFALFAAGAAPSVTFGDAGEFSACAAMLGLPHAPDYPLYTLASRAFAVLVPFGGFAYRTNLFSAACAAAALAVLGSAMRRWELPRAARLGALAALAGSSLWREQAGVTEVFGLHLLLCACVLRLLAEPPAARWAAALGLLFGLGAGNHHTLALAGPAAALHARARPRLAGWLLAFAAVGFSIYAYLPIRAAASPPLDWGHPVDAGRFSRALLRKDYGSLSLTSDGRGSGRGPLAQLGRWAGAAAGGLGWPMLLLALAGAAAWSGGPRGALLLWLLALGPGFLWLGDPPFDAQTSNALQRFYLASWLALAPLAAAGAAAAGRLSPLAGAFAAAALALGAWLPAGWAAGSSRGDFGGYDYGRAIQASLPQDAVLVMDGGDDTFYALSYLTYALGRRADVSLHDRGGVVFPSLYGAGFRALSKELREPVRLAAEAPLAAAGRLFYSTLNETLLPGFDLRPWGLLRRPARPGAPATPDMSPFVYERFEESRLEERYRDRALAAFYPYQRAVAKGRGADFDGAYAELARVWALAPDALWTAPNVGYQAGMLGWKAAQAKDWARAGRFFALWRECEPAKSEPVVNLGVVAEKTGRLDEARALYARAAVLDPRSPLPPYHAGSLEWAAGRWAAAAEHMEAASRLKPGDAAMARYAAEARRRAGR